MQGQLITLNNKTLTINNKSYILPSNKPLKVLNKGIFCGIYELKDNKWKISIKSIKQLWNY